MLTCYGDEVRLPQSDLAYVGFRLAAGAEYDPVAWVWDVASGKEVGRFPGHDGYGVRSVAFSPDGRLLTTGSYDGPANVALRKRIHQKCGAASDAFQRVTDWHLRHPLL